MAAVQPLSPLLDPQKPFDVGLLDATVKAFYGTGNNQERAQAEAVLQQLQKQEDAWTKVDGILENATYEQTKFFGLQILEEVIKFRWGLLPEEQREGIKNYTAGLIIKLSSDATVFKQQKVFISKLNIILVQILKQDWPHKWPTFIPDIVGASKTSETLCENSMQILKLLSEEVFDFSRGELTQAKIKELKSSMTKEFNAIYELCLFVLGASQKPDLIRATLSTLHAYLSWMPIAYIFQTNVVEQLLKLFPLPAFRNAAIQCLTEIGSLETEPEMDPHFEQLYKVFETLLQQVLPPEVDMAQLYPTWRDDEQTFVQNLALFLTGFLKPHSRILETTDENKAALLVGLSYLLNLSFIDNDEVFKICLDYWHFFVPEVYSSTYLEQAAHFAFTPAAAPRTSRKQLYAPVLSRLRLVMISKMAKPEEVIVVEDENGNIVRETMKDTDTLARYKTMHETLVYLCNLDHEDTEQQMLDKLRLQVKPLNGKEWSWTGLNTLCWAIGSISGAMQEEQENRFLVTVIRDLLNLCEITRGKDNKAVIASNIMYVVGQYPRFLRNHWKFLKTVVNKLFEFMHETHPGVQDMACETFLKICSKCKRKFVVLQLGETEPFICELLDNLVSTIGDLEPHQIHMFFEAVGLMISAENTQEKQAQYLERLMTPANSTWMETINHAKAAPETLNNTEVMKHIQNILQSNVSVCSSLGHPFVTQISRIFTDMLAVYRMYSELISAAISTGGPHASKTSQVKLMRTIKKTILKLIETFSDKCTDQRLIAEDLVPAMMDPILGDYARSVPDARDAEVMSLFAAIINKLQEKMQPNVPRIFEAVFQSTLEMITKNFEDYPEHRLQFFSLLRAITNHCFATLCTMSPAQSKLVMDSIVWAFRHTERNVAETGLNLLMEMLQKFQESEFATSFHQTYYLQLMQEIFAVMTDTFHKPGFKLHVRILHHLFSIVNQGVIKGPLWDVAAKGPTAYPNNAAFVQEYVSNLLTTSFPNMRPQQVQACVAGMFELQEPSAFKEHLRDFLVQTKGFASSDNADLYAEEAERQRQAERERMSNIPGMLHPHEQQEEMADV
jgi:exportin-1